LESIWGRVHELAAMLRRRLTGMPGVTVRDLGAVRCGIVTFTVDGHEPKALRDRLAQEGINVWYSVASSTLLDMTDRGLDSLVRASVHYYNTEEEIDRFCERLAALRG
jgi:selenocysteine lyase/cysteine desulfurase